MTTLEIIANALTLTCIILAGQNHKATWPVGIAACIAFGLLFYDSRLYADAILQVFFIGTSIYGLVWWKENAKIRALDPILCAMYVVLAGVIALMYGMLLHLYTDAYAPFVDSMVLAFSVLGQLLLMSRFKATWWIWLFVNTLSVPLFFSRELYLTSALYTFYWFHAIYSIRKWNEMFRKQSY